MFCLKEPDSFCGGETVLLKNQDLTAILDPEVISKFEEKKVRYQAFLPNKTTDAGLQKSWQDRFWLEDAQVCMNWFYYVVTPMKHQKKKYDIFTCEQVIMTTDT